MGKNKKILTIKWQRLVSDGQTCPRCGSTETELEKVVSILKRSFAALGIEVKLEKKALSLKAFNRNPSESNRIWINGKPLETWVNAESGQSKCCDVCGDTECRTVEIAGQVYETVPSKLVIQAALIAASQLFSHNTTKSSGSCCPEYT